MWESVEAQWDARLNGIPFHARDCENDQGDFKENSHAANKALYRDLVTILCNSQLGGFGIAMDLIAMQRNFPGALELAYFRAFAEIMERVNDFTIHFSELAKFTFDINTASEYNAAFIYSTMREDDSEMFSHLHSEITFVGARENSRLQTADLLAYESMKALDHVVGPVKRKRRSWEAMRATDRFETYGYSDEWFNTLKDRYSALEQRVGFNVEDYQQWLEQRRRQDNLSNKFAFLNWIAQRDRKAN